MTVPYIIAFTQGSSGRFVKYLLYNLLTDSHEDIQNNYQTNSAHGSDDRRYTGFTESKELDVYNANHEDNYKVWDLFQFDDPLREPMAPKILATHIYPDFERIKNNLGPDVKIIIIAVHPMDLMEVVINDKLKNYFDVFQGKSPDTNHPSTIPDLISRYNKFVGKKYNPMFNKEDIIQIGKGCGIETLQYFLSKLWDNDERWKNSHFDSRLMPYMVSQDNIDWPADQLLILPYGAIADKIDGEYIWLKKLEKLTGAKANEVTKAAFKKYIDGRAKLIEQYRI